MTKPAPAAENRDRTEFFTKLEAALTPKVRATVNGYARRRYHLLKNAGLNVDEPFARHIVTDVITDTATGRLTWNPDRVKLATHLCGAIKSRTHKMLLRHKKHRHLSLSPPDQEVLDFEPSEGRIEVSASLVVGTNPKQAYERADRLARLRARLRTASVEHGDTIAVKLLDSYQLDVASRHDLQQVGITTAQYDLARKRLLHRARVLS